MGKSVLKIIAVFVIGLIGGIFADQIFWPYFVERPLFYKYSLEQRPVEITKREEIVIQENQALQDAVEEARPSVVALQHGKQSGTGFIITSDGMLVTLKSVADGTSTVFYQDQQLKASLVKTEGDFSVLRIDKNNLPTQHIVDANQVRLGQRVFLIGKLFRNEDLFTVVNHGIVKYFKSNEVHTNIFEIDALKGSPLLDIKGNVVGLVKIDQQGKVVGTALPEISQLLEGH